MAKRALLLYSGGLDTSVMLKLLQDRLGMDVVTLTLDIGQEENDLKSIRDKAINLGAVETISKDVKKKFAAEFISKEIKADGMYDGVYPLSTSVARPLMSQEAVYAADQYDCDVVVHGCTGKGNDQIRFEVSIKALNNDLEVIAPIRDWNLNRDLEIGYAKKNGIPIKLDGKYSIDENLWGRSVEGSELEDLMKPIPEDAYSWVRPLGFASPGPTYVSLGFEEGLPVSLNGRALEKHELISELNSIAGINGFGGIDHLEDRVTGIKSREFYECPAALTILSAHKALERLTLSKEETTVKNTLDAKWSDMVYAGLWFDPLITHINAFEDSINLPVSGTVNLSLRQGTCQVTGVESSNSLYNYEVSTYGSNDTFDQSMAKGFIGIFGMQTINTSKVRRREIKSIIRS